MPHTTDIQMIRSHPALRAAIRLSFIIGPLAALAAGWGAFTPGLYRDNLWTSSQLRGNDFVTLFVALPLFVVATVYAMKGTPRGLLTWLAGLHFMIYNFTFYLFGAAYNRMFLPYSAIVGLSILALIVAVAALDLGAIGRGFPHTTPRWWTAGFLLVVGVVLAALWVGQSVGFLATGELPASVPASGHPTAVVFAVDLTLLVPYFLLAGAWLWRRNPLGYSLGTVVSLSGAVYTLALAAMGLAADASVVEGARFLVPVWITVSAAGTAVGIALLRNAPHACTRPAPSANA